MYESPFPAGSDAEQGAPSPTVGEPFRSFYAYYGETLLGRPVSTVVLEGGRKCQYFENVALEEGSPGTVRLKPLGRDWLAARAEARARHVGGQSEPVLVDLTAALARHATKTYPLRALEDIRYLVVHHTGASGEATVQAIAEEHVRVNDWPGIGYHFVIDTDGTAYRTQDLTVVSHHARQFNPASVGIALVGDLSTALPTAEQIESTAGLLAALLRELGLPATSVRGHREMVATPCPGETFLAVWKPRLMALAAGAAPGAAGEGQAPGEPVAVDAAGPVDFAVATAPAETATSGTALALPLEAFAPRARGDVPSGTGEAPVPSTDPGAAMEPPPDGHAPPLTEEPPAR
jgi:hypothetical protein